METQTQARDQSIIDPLAASRIVVTCKRYRSLALTLRTLLNQARNVHHRDGFCVLPTR